jgi:hypothetical protein
MSLKSQVFTAGLGGLSPANTYNYVVQIPEFPEISILASSVTCPTLKRGQVTVQFWGQEMILPTPSEDSSGEINITISERMDMLMRWRVYKMFLDQENVLDHNYFSLCVSSIQGVIPVAPIIYQNCWFKQMSDIQFNSSAATQPMTYTLTFVYNGIDQSIKKHYGPLALMAEQAASLIIERGFQRTTEDM